MGITTSCFTVNNVPFFAAILKYSFSELFNNFLRFNFYKILTEFCENSKVVFSNFSMIKNIVDQWSWFSSLPIKLICWGFFNLVCLLKSIATNLKFLWNKQNPINYQLCSHYSTHLNKFVISFFLIFYWQVKETFSIN